MQTTAEMSTGKVMKWIDGGFPAANMQESTVANLLMIDVNDTYWNLVQLDQIVKLEILRFVFI